MLFGMPGAVPAQPVAFGAWDDPSEQLQEVWWRRESSLDVMSGLSLIAAQWRGAASLSANLVTRPVTARLRGTVRAGTLGRYRPDLDEPYDALRLLEFMRFTPPRRSTTHVRIGLINRTRLGTGHLMDFYRSDMAWDERTVGAELYHAWRFGAIEALTDNLLLDRVVGGRLMLQPLGWTGSPRFGSLRLGVSYVTDLQTHRADARPLIGYNVDASFDAFNSGSIVLQPFASVAWYRHQGRGLAFGATVDSPNFIDLARFHLRMVLYYSGEAFIPGYFGAFYTVHNPHARILNGERFLADSTAQRVVGVPLEAARGAMPSPPSCASTSSSSSSCGTSSAGTTARRRSATTICASTSTPAIACAWASEPTGAASAVSARSSATWATRRPSSSTWTTASPGRCGCSCTPATPTSAGPMPRTAPRATWSSAASNPSPVSASACRGFPARGPGR
ncbi:hypothetical protein AWN76_002825 [Rhodothermaceae bacterium RA]|nr:hypothetical protein AWN76_002825 [Rhodothermaceae bacterium RA]